MGSGISLQFCQLALLLFLGVFGFPSLLLALGEDGFFFCDFVVGHVIPPWG
jgi:hypothetical protein